MFPLRFVATTLISLLHISVTNDRNTLFNHIPFCCNGMNLFSCYNECKWTGFDF